MKALILSSFMLGLSLPAAARCVVEIIGSDGYPMGHVFQERSCPPAMTKCQAQLGRLGIPGAVCEITLDVPGQKIDQEFSETDY